ncbi:hypothetical protein N0V85_004237 [Neurospora sp. IMI 360204]|nr:hypothetical protein N0V85_004237 [Neurospora sp. IMI 360204]
MAPQRSLLQGAFLLPFLVSSISAFPYNTNSDANSKATDLNLNLLKPRSHFPTLFKRSSSGFSPTSPSTLAAKVSDTDCSFPCAGERIEVYTNALYRPPTNAKVPGFDYMGCYRESSPRLLPNSLLGDDTLTTAKCAAYCTNLSFPYFGLEYGRECWCGVSPPFDSQRVPETECSMTCAGAPGEICGAGNRINVYEKQMEKPADVGDYTYKGCYTDTPVTGEKSLTGKVTYDALMTLDKCRMTCEEDEYPYFGTEYGSQCFCGTKLYDAPESVGDSGDEDNYPPRALKVEDCECSMRCGGDAKNGTTCGDANRLSVYWNGEVSEAGNLDPEDFADADLPVFFL